MKTEDDVNSNAPPLAPGTDIAWKYGTKGDLSGQVICNFCKRPYRGGINRLKYHLARIPGKDVALCSAAPPKVVREMQALLATPSQKKVEKQKTKMAVGAGIGGNVSFEDSVSNSLFAQNQCSEPNENSTLPASMRHKTMEGFFVPPTKAQPSLDTTSWGKDKIQAARRATVNFWYYGNIPFNVASSPY